MCRFIPSTLYPNRILNCDYNIYDTNKGDDKDKDSLNFLLNVQYRSKVSHL